MIISIPKAYHKLFILSVLLALIGCASKGDPNDYYKDLSAEVIYKKGINNTRDGKYTTAIKDFEALEARFPFGDYTEKGQLAILHAYVKKADNSLALAAADRFIRLYPNHEHIDYVYYIKGLANFNENLSFTYQYFPLDRSIREPLEANDAFDNFDIVITRYPKSQYAPDARQRMVYLKNQLAKYELHVANYYMKRKAYLAAANRAAGIVKAFQQTEVIPDALKIMVKAYKAMDMMALSNDAQKVLDLNFPKG